jgi:hypothetical protein
MKNILTGIALFIIISACTRHFGKPEDFRMDGKDTTYDLATETYLQNLYDLENEMIILKNEIDSAFNADLQIADDQQKRDIYRVWHKFIVTSQFLYDIRTMGDSLMNAPEGSDPYGFLIFYTAHIQAYDLSLHLIRQANKNSLYDVLLNEEISERKLPAGLFDQIKLNVLHVSELSGMEDGYDLYSYLKGQNAFDREISLVSLAMDMIELKYRVYSAVVKSRSLVMLSKNGADIVGKKMKKAFFPLKESFLRTLSETRMTRRKIALITPMQCDTILQNSLPGDIVLQRQEWYMTNYGIPGFWSHAALYLGSCQQLLDYASDPAVTDYYRQSDSTYLDFDTYMSNKYPDSWKLYKKGDAESEPLVYLEAIAEGVTLNTAKNSIGHCDYAAVLRPRLPKELIVKAVERAFARHGKPYDYDFDFRKNSALVCSGLIYQAYQKDADFAGLNFTTGKIAGKIVMPPNLIADKYRNERSGTNELELIIFYDSDDKKAFISTENQFINLQKRHEWHLWFY